MMTYRQLACLIGISDAVYAHIRDTSVKLPADVLIRALILAAQKEKNEKLCRYCRATLPRHYYNCPTGKGGEGDYA